MNTSNNKQPFMSADRMLPSLLPAWREFETVPILNYGWTPKTQDDAQRQDVLAEYLEMGLTGIYKGDADAGQKAGRLFIERGLHGRMPEIQFFGPGEPTLDRDGKPQQYRRNHPWTRKGIFSSVSRDAYYARALATVNDYGATNLFACGDTILMSSWDETGLYTRERMEYGYGAKGEFIDYLRQVVFHDDLPAFRRSTALDVETWQDIPLPVFEERYETPGLWKHWIDFHAYYTYLFFRRGGQYVSDAIGRDVELWTFSHASAKWPGGASGGGIDQYWASRLNRGMTVEDCQASYPGSTIHYSYTDQLSRRYGVPVLGWSWFWSEPERSNDPLAVARALARAMGHNTHGLLFWVYNVERRDETWGKKPAARAAVAYWHHVFQAHWDFLRNAERPKPDVAVVFPRNTGNMYNRFEYLKLDYGWTIAALTEAHVSFEVVGDNQVEFEPDILSDYRVLLIPTATWESPAFRLAIERFLENGGYVYTCGDSFMRDTATGQITDFLARHFGVRPSGKHKGLFYPTRDSAREQAWAADLAGEWQRPVVVSGHLWKPSAGEELKPLCPSDDDLRRLRDGLPPVSGSGLVQSLWDPKTPQWIEAEAQSGLPPRHRTYHDIVTGQLTGDAVALARYGTDVCAVETRQTVWTGFRPGFDHACAYPIRDMREWGEAFWPFEFNTAQTAKERETARKWITRIVGKAGVTPAIEVLHGGEQAAHVEILMRRDPAGDALIFVVNHENIAGAYQLAGETIGTAEALAEVRGGTMLEKDASGRVEITLPAFDVAIVAAGHAAFIRERIAAHAKIPNL